MRIDRCICRETTFEELKRIARLNGADDVESLQKVIKFGDTCRLCQPYVREMLASGKTVFFEILASADSR